MALCQNDAGLNQGDVVLQRLTARSKDQKQGCLTPTFFTCLSKLAGMAEISRYDIMVRTQNTNACFARTDLLFLIA
jgi:hypothetical protein